MEYEILKEEAYVTTFSLNTDFRYKGLKYEATCQYYNCGGIEDIDVWRENLDIITDELKTLEKIANANLIFCRVINSQELTKKTLV